MTEVLQYIKAWEMTPMLQRIFKSEGGAETLDVLMKYLYVLACLLAGWLSLLYRVFRQAD